MLAILPLHPHNKVMRKNFKGVVQQCNTNIKLKVVIDHWCL